MSRMRALVVGLFVLAGCAKTKAKLFCDVAVENGPYADANGRDRCMQEYLDAGAAERDCYDGCRAQKNRFAFSDCMTKCRGGQVPAHAWPPVTSADAAADAR